MKLKNYITEQIKNLKRDYGELMHGVEKSQTVERNRAAITLFLPSVSILPFDDYAAEEYGKIHADLERKETPTGPMDMLDCRSCKIRRADSCDK